MLSMSAKNYKGWIQSQKVRRPYENDSALTHPDLSEAALPQFQVEAEGLSRNLPGVPGQSLRLRFGHGTHVRESVTQAVGVL